MKAWDTLRNLVTGLGGEKDKSVTTAFAWRTVDDTELNAMYRSDWIARKIVDIIPNDMTREWRNWQSDGDSIEDIEEYEAKPLISVPLKINRAMQLARKDGWSYLFIGIANADHSKELDPEKIGKDGLQYLHVLSKKQAVAGNLVTDVTSEFFGEPENYTVTGKNGTTSVIHPSRMIRFLGAPVLDEDQAPTTPGDSILQIVYDAIQNAASSQQHLAALLNEAKQDIIYIPKLSDYLKNANTTQTLTNRFTYANSIKSLFNMVLLEGDGEKGERWEQKQINFSQLPEVTLLFLKIASGAADIPVTRFLGESPSGLNATGESDLQNYYDNIAARQRTELSPQMQRLDEVLIRSATGKRDESTYYEWAPLWGMSEKEKADIFKTKVEAARAIAGSAAGELMPVEALSDALVNMLVEDGSLPGLEAAIEEYGKLSEQEEDDDDLIAAQNTLPPGQASPPAALPAPGGAKQPELIDAAPRSLYVRRDVVNKADLKRWAKSQGLTMVDDPHVTIVYSRASVDWMKIRPSYSSTIEIEGGPRLMDLFSPTGDTLVLLIPVVSDLRWRHEEFKEAGASSDYDEYNPHITIVKGFTGKLEDIKPYQGKIVLGPEVFEEVKP